MAYRDELEAAQARAAALERELQAAKDEIADLKGEPKRALVKFDPAGTALAIAGGKSHSRWLGAPTHLSLERTLDGVLPEADYVLVVEHVSDFFGRTGQATTLSGALHIVYPPTSNRPVEIRVSSRNGKTRIRIDESLRQAAAGVYVGGGFTAALVGTSVAAATLGVLGVLFIPAAALGARYGFARLARGHAEKLATLLDELETLIANCIASHAAQQETAAASDHSA